QPGRPALQGRGHRADRLVPRRRRSRFHHRLDIVGQWRPAYVLSRGQEVVTANTIYTIGHSTRSVAELVALLREAGVDLLVDVRSVPRSRTNPQFNTDALPEALAEAGIGYRHIRALGGLRHHPKGAPRSPNTLWRNDAFRNYADYAMTETFRAGLAELRALADEHRCAIM